MFGGDDDDGAQLFQHLAGGLTGGSASSNWAHRFRPQPRAYDEYLKAYSMAMLPGRERENVSFGGKIIMPPSALARLSSLELESPWQFQLRNPQNPAASTHCGVLEFIADEGVVHLPHWMMQTLRLSEGDMIRITGAQLPKGKFVKLQAQSVDFLEVSDPKAVLEQALRNFSALTQGDIVEIIYNRIVFGMLVMEIKPEGAGISIFETDLEVDFAAPVGYIEPVRPTPAPPATMASKLKIDLSSATPGSSRPGSALAGSAPGPTGDWESFKGRGETLNGRKTKGKGKSVRKIEDVADGSRIYRTDKTRTVTADDLDTDVKVPAALNVPFGKLFFGYNYVPYKPDDTSTGGSTTSPPPVPVTPAFGGAGNTLSGKTPRSTPSSAAKGKSRAVEPPAPAWASSGGQSLGSRKKAISIPDDDEYDDDVIDIDSD